MTAPSRNRRRRHRRREFPLSAPVRAPEAAAIVLNQQEVQGILGRQVLSTTGEDMGRVIDVVVDRAGQVRAAVIDFGGFLGVGNRKVAIDWGALRFWPTGSNYDRITLELTRDQVKAAPEYKDGQAIGRDGALRSGASSPRHRPTKRPAGRAGGSEARPARSPANPSPRSLRGLDWFAFFVADIQTGFGPFLAVYFTTQKWTQVDIGLVLAIGSFASLLGQVPGGWLVD